MITLDDLKAICPLSKRERLDLFVEPLNAAMTQFEINNVARETAFLAQVAHESGGFRYVRELASGAAYEGRADLGNTEPGDGIRFRGRGLIQITGRSNYADCSIALFGDNRLLDRPELLEETINAAGSAGWYWQEHALNELADAGDFRAITRKINGGYNGWDDRMAYFKRAQEVFA